MPPSLPPYALGAPSFPFRHLAAAAGRAPIGGTREVVLACFVVARLAADSPGAGLPAEGRAARAAGAKAWLGTLTLPVSVRAPLAACAEASAGEPSTSVAASVANLAEAAGSFLDAPSHAELDALAERLRR